MANDASGSRDEFVSTLSADGSLSARALVATELVGEAASRHATAPTATAALGRTLMGALLLAAEAPDEERVQVHFRGDGPVRTLLAIATRAGEVRGLVGDPTAHLPPRDGKLDVAGVVGSGTLAVVRHYPRGREPYSGYVPIVSGEIAEDLASYLLESEQTPAVVALGVYVGSDGAVGAAAGYLVRAMPGADPAALDQLEANVRRLASPSELVRQGLRPEDVLERLLRGLGTSTQHRLSPSFRCPCDRERILRAVLAMGRSELLEVRARKEDLKVRCEFCRDEYVISPDEVGALIGDA